jgi:DNA-binding CsgD family transcriptional regulator
MKDLREYFGFLGWNCDDVICIGKLQDGNWTNELLKLSDFLNDCEQNGIPGDIDLYYACGSFWKSARSRKKRDVRCMKELVLDIDFKAVDSDRAVAEQKANDFIQTLPLPTVLIHSGNGYHLHYKLYEHDKFEPFSEGCIGDILRRKHNAEGRMVKQEVCKHQYESTCSRLVSWFNSKHPGYLDACWSCEHVFRLPFSNNCKDPSNVKPVQIIARSSVQYTLDDFAKLVPEGFKVDDLSRTEAQRAVIRAACRRAAKTCAYDRSKAVYSVVQKVRGLIHNVSDVTIVSVLKQFPELIERYSTEQELRKDVRRIMSKTAAQGIAAVLPIECLQLYKGYDLSQVEEKRWLFDKSVFDTRNGNERKFDAMLQVYDRLWNDGKSGIVSVPCSSSKTFSALIYAACLSEKLKGWSKHIWFVSEKITDCTRNAEVLQKMNVRAIAYHGRPDTCPVQQSDFLQGQPCRDCQNQCGAAIKHLHGLEYALNRCDVLCCTHKFLAGEIAKGVSINAELIIIDESPVLFETYEMTRNDMRLIRQHLEGDPCLDDDFGVEVATPLKEALTDKGTHRIEEVDAGKYARSLALAYVYANKKEYLAEERLEALLGFYGFFKNAKNIYGMKTQNGYRFIAGQIDVNIPESAVWILDGSAKNQLTKWKGFKIFEVPELKTEYPNMKIKLILGNPTKSNLGKESTRDALVREAEKLIGTTTMLFTNRTTEGESEKTVQAVERVLLNNGCDVIRMHRGEHIGSNKGRTANSNLICMSLFSDVTDYALRASLYYNKEFLESDIFGKQKIGEREVDFVKMRKGGFENAQIRDLAARAMQRDLYQCIMRGIVRDNPDAAYEVTAITADETIMHALSEDLPGAEIHTGNQSVIELWLNGETNKDIAQKLNVSDSAVSQAIKMFQSKIGLTDDREKG